MQRAAGTETLPRRINLELKGIYMSGNRNIHIRRGRLAVVLTALCGLMASGTAARLMAEEKKQKTELNKQMEQIDEGMKKLRRTLRKKDENAQSLEIVTKIEQAALACKSMTPSTATTLPSDQQPKFVADYRKQMASLIASMCNMEEALLDGENAKAQEVYKQLKSQEETGHDKFMPSDDSAGAAKPEK